MDINEFFLKPYLTVDELEGLGSGGGVATILGNARTETVKTRDSSYSVMYVDVQLAKNKSIRPLRLGTKGSPNQACKTLRSLFGGNTDDWVGKVVHFFPYSYAEGKRTLGVKLYDLNIDNVLRNR